MFRNTWHPVFLRPALWTLQLTPDQRSVMAVTMSATSAESGPVVKWLDRNHMSAAARQIEEGFTAAMWWWREGRKGEIEPPLIDHLTAGRLPSENTSRWLFNLHTSPKGRRRKTDVCLRFFCQKCPFSFHSWCLSLHVQYAPGLN